MTSPVTWSVPRESVEWLGPIVTTLTSRETGLPVTQHVTFALWLRDGTRPTEDDFAAPDLDPDGTGAYGIMLTAVSVAAGYGVWARDADSPESPWLEPAQVGYLERT